MSILLFPDEALTTPCDPVEHFGGDLLDEIQLMRDAMAQSRIKVMGIAANQVGVMKRILIMTNAVFINPAILKRSKTPANKAEMCLSSPGVREIVASRVDYVLIKYRTEDGKLRTGEIGGFEAVCMQHEMDHLDGIFWFSKLSNTGKKKVRKLKKSWGGHPVFAK